MTNNRARTEQANSALRIPSPLIAYLSPHPLQPSGQQHAWLTRSGSLTEALRALGTFSLTIVCEGKFTACPQDAALLGVEEQTPLWVRDVALCVNDTPYVYAHSISPYETTEPLAAWSVLRRHGHEPLGTLLYNDTDIQRSGFSWQAVECPKGMHHVDPAIKNGAPLWARHSCFMRLKQPLVITETFLTAFWQHPNIAELTR